MKIVTFLLLIMLSFSVVNAQDNRTSILQDLENNKVSAKDTKVTATLKSASRLFETKYDLTTVILIIPAGSVVDVLGSDSTYLQVTYEEYEGYIFRLYAELSETPVVIEAETVPVNVQEKKPVEEQQAPTPKQSRFSYLEYKYGSSTAAKLMSGKIWKGMNAEMVNDSWGTPKKINRVISGNTVKEEWIYKSTWLYIENDRLVEWGPIRQ